MWFLYLDESGDLGFDFVNKKPSKFFTITILAISGIDKNRALINCVKHAISRKFYRKSNNVIELKGSKTSLEIKRYFFERCKNIKFGIYALTLNKRRLYEKLSKDKERVYNYIARLVMDKIPFEKAISRVELIVDKSKSKPEIEEFNSYIMRALKGRLDPKVPLDIYHYLSHENRGLQAADLFCWGIFRKYEKKDTEWLEIFRQDKVRYEDLYLS
ncbi:MAG: DUF3800 domain-containing protein [Candidatus Omnitrophota bacterium]